MKDIKELIFAAVEENAVKFQELAYDKLHSIAYEQIEALRPQVAASLFGEAKECDEEEMEDDKEEKEDDKEEKKSEKKSEVDEELKGSQHKIDKNKNGKIDAHDFKLLRKEETNIQEVAPPQNQADWQAIINHQIKVTGHPVATDAQFRAVTHGKDMSKRASLEPGEDKLQYAKAQGGNVKP